MVVDTVDAVAEIDVVDSDVAVAVGIAAESAEIVVIVEIPVDTRSVIDSTPGMVAVAMQLSVLIAAVAVVLVLVVRLL